MNLFEIFSKASNNSQSAGLGLYMIKVCAEKLGGTVEFLDETNSITNS
ncbi:MAG: hypothetical protein M3512_03165 [Bacteroidota bacterium]|nr:hypothetical protein [Bacteroidota bacterium]